MTHETPQDYEITPFVIDMVDRLQAPYNRVIACADQEGLTNEVITLQENQKEKTNEAVSTYLAGLNSGLIDDPHLALDMAIAQNNLQEARKAVGALAVDEEIREDLVGGLTSQIDQSEKSHVTAYRARVRRFIAETFLSEVQKPRAKAVELLTQEEIEAQFDTSSISHTNIEGMGMSPSQTGRVWKALLRLADLDRSYRIRSGENRDFVVVIGTENPRPRLKQVGENNYDFKQATADIDFVSLYNVMEWTEAELKRNPRTLPSEILAKNIGHGALNLFRELIESRRTN